MRIARHMSLSELSRATRMSKATLSGIENGRANPTVETLASLAGALGASLVELLEEPPLGDMRVVRAGDARSSADVGAPRRVLEALAAGGRAELAELALADGSVCELEAGAAGSRAHVYVREGTLLAGPVERHTELCGGDYASFPADVAHVYEAPRGPVRALLMTLVPL